MDALKEGWFSELSPDDLAAIKGQSSDDKQLKSDGVEMGSPWPGQAFSLKVEEVLFEGRSDFQDVIVFRSKAHGNVLVLDNVIQCTERDEFSYQEMLTHLPMFAHKNPKKVLIIGGGDGGILREVLKHDQVEEVHMCEIDKMVIDVSKKYLPNMAKELGNPKFKLFIDDGFKFLKNHENEYDVVITDSSDPIGPAESLFGQTFYELINKALKPNGVLASQCESFWLHLDLIAHMVKFNRRIFKNVRYASSVVSTYPSGVMGYLLASKGPEENELSVPKRAVTPAQREQLRFYSGDVHSAAFVLPAFVHETLI
ncbi:unnamed protein product [Bursaphelenchus okinawaensis]|uniref:PABS domain-containing protein n=1 Tax=Bursaphelenchus okinawaensis TaxID=465554 RepID=A0A811K4Y8_9BILA|nr:unnamed protein product [Bursaphelenchus okinawaensis]CAG9092598.1 unnamed protein product [Bursaphelenchus okinawaensis]